MASSAASSISAADLKSFHDHLQSSTRILALLGAGLSASSGLPTFRGQGGIWRTHDATSLATMEAFTADPALVWHFYSYRRHMALNAEPNKAHYALAELAKKKSYFQTLSQNVDGKSEPFSLSQRAGHPPSQLQLLHGNLFDVKCMNFFCNYRGTNFDDPIVPALELPTEDVDPTTNAAREQKARELDISDASISLPELALKDLPHCPECHDGLLRPGVVWFGEMLPKKTLNTIDAFIAEAPSIDLMLVIGTSSQVYPAASYVEYARRKGARVAVINMERTDALADGDWFFQGDAGVVVPELLRPVVGDLSGAEEVNMV